MTFLDSSVQLPHLKLKNPFLRSAVHSFLGTEDGFMTDAEYNMYDELSKNGLGLIITGHCCVAAGGLANKEQIRIDDDCYIDQFKKAAALVHENGSRLMVQINHAGPRAIDTTDWADASEDDVKKNQHARAMTIEEIEKVRDAFIKSAQRLKDTGVDGVQIHAAHSYLLSRFIDATFNHRTDNYGGPIENRFRLCEEIISGIKKACGADFPVAIKINNDTITDDEQYEKDMHYVIEKCLSLGIEFIEWSGVDFLNQPRTATLYYFDRIARLAAFEPRLAMSIVGGVKSLADIEKVLQSPIKLISLGRALICEPDILKRLAAKSTERSSCLSCNRCFALPHLHKNVRCVLQWKKIKAAAKEK